MLKLDQVRCEYDDVPVVSDVSFHVNEGDICSLLGPSGCGKTTLLRAIAGFVDVAAGSIEVDGKTLSRAGQTLAPEKRQVGMVFQDYALFPHLTVAENVAFGISTQPPKKRQARVSALLELVHLSGTEHRYPTELSGGQQQRVALARALAPGPRLLLMDEPFSNLDAELRKRLSLEVRDILKDYGITAVLVTHDQDEAFAFSDHVGLLHGGKLQQWDTPFNLYHEPNNRLVADFIGQGSFIPGVMEKGNLVETELGPLMGNRAYPWPDQTRVDVLLRPDDITLCEEEGMGLKATVDSRVFAGSATLYTLSLPTGSKVEAMLPSHHDFLPGEELQIQAEVEHLIAFRHGEE